MEKKREIIAQNKQKIVDNKKFNALKERIDTLEQGFEQEIEFLKEKLEKLDNLIRKLGLE